MSKIQVTLTFDTPAEAVEALARLQGPSPAPAQPAGNASASKAKPAAPNSAPAAAPASTASSKPAGESQPPAASGEVSYADLKKAVLKLAQLDRAAAEAVAKSLGVANFKDGYEADDKAPGRAAALAAVNAKLAELGAQP